MKHQQPDDLVSSVNGQTGVVVLAASDVGARSAATPLSISEVTGLQTLLDAKATATALTSGLAGKTSPADVQSTLASSVPIKQVVRVVATSNVASLSGQQSVDGVLLSLGDLVLLTAQSSSINNGIYVVASGAWSRAADMDAGSYLVKGTLVLVSGGNNANTFWQETNTSGVVGTNANNWVKAMQAGPPVTYSNGNGLNLSNNVFSVKTTTGCVATSNGVGIDTTIVPRKYATDVPAGATVVTITHNLGTTDISCVWLMDKASGDYRLICPTVTGINTISLDFAVAPTSGQYRVVVTA